MINAEWHLANPVPKNATIDERIAWHLAHASNCGCREMPPAIRDEIRRRGLRIPATPDRPRHEGHR